MVSLATLALMAVIALVISDRATLGASAAASVFYAFWPVTD